MAPMERWDLVQSASEPGDSSWIEDFADETLGDPEANGQFLDQVLSPSRRASRNLRDSLRKLVPHRESASVAISRAFGYLVSWPVGSPHQIGDIGVFDSKTSFTKLTEISELGIEIPSTDIVTQPLATDLNYTTGDVSVVVTKTGVRLEFAQAGGAFFLATGLSSQRISGRAKFAQQLLELVRAEQWLAEWNAVTETVEARLALFFVAGEDDASVELLGDPRSPHAAATTDETPNIVSQHGMRLTAAAHGAVALFRTTEINKTGRFKVVQSFD